MSEDIPKMTELAFEAASVPSLVALSDSSPTGNLVNKAVSFTTIPLTSSSMEVCQAEDRDHLSRQLQLWSSVVDARAVAFEETKKKRILGLQKLKGIQKLRDAEREARNAAAVEVRNLGTVVKEFEEERQEWQSLKERSDKAKAALERATQRLTDLERRLTEKNREFADSIESLDQRHEKEILEIDQDFAIKLSTAQARVDSEMKAQEKELAELNVKHREELERHAKEAEIDFRRETNVYAEELEREVEMAKKNEEWMRMKIERLETDGKIKVAELKRMVDKRDPSNKLDKEGARRKTSRKHLQNVSSGNTLIKKAKKGILKTKGTVHPTEGEINDSDLLTEDELPDIGTSGVASNVEGNGKIDRDLQITSQDDSDVKPY